MKLRKATLMLLCSIFALAGKAAVGDTFEVTYNFSSTKVTTIRYQVSGENPNTVKIVERPNQGFNEPVDAKVVVPETVSYNGEAYTVTEVADKAFYAWNGVSLTLPNTVVSIGAHAFIRSEFTSIDIGTGVKSIGEYCFDHSKIESIVIPEGVTSLGFACFNLCESLQSASLPSTLNTVPQSCFSECSSLSQVTLAPGIDTLFTQCFYRCTALTEVTIPASVVAFGTQSRPFAGCNNIRSITFEWTEMPAALSTRKPFDDNILANATIYVPKGCESLYAEALGISTANIVSPSTGTIFTAEVDGQTVTFMITDDQANICQVGDGTNAAIDATYTGTLAMPATVSFLNTAFAITKVGDYAFKDCQLTGFSFGNITEVGSQAFYGSKLASLNLGNVRTIGIEAFRNCSFTTVDITNVRTVGAYAFANGRLTQVMPYVFQGGGISLSPAFRLPDTNIVGDSGGSGSGGSSGSGPSSIGDGSFSNNQISDLNLEGSNLSDIPNNAFQNNNISNLDLGNVESAGDYAFNSNNISNLNTKQLQHMGKECFGNNPLKTIEFGTGSDSSTDFSSNPADHPFGDAGEIGEVGTIIAGGASEAAVTYFFGSYGTKFLAAGVLVTATSAAVWKWLMDKRKDNNKDDGGSDSGDDDDEGEESDRDKADKISFAFAESPAPTETCVDTYVPYSIQHPSGMDVTFETEECTVDEEARTIHVADHPGIAVITAKFKNKSGFHYDEKDIALRLPISDTDDCDPDKDKIPTLNFIDREIMAPRFGTINVRVNYTNMTKEEASGVVFALKADPLSETDGVLDQGLLNYMKVVKKEDTDGTVNGGWPYAQITASWDPVTLKNLIGLGRYLTATLDVQRYRKYHLTDQTTAFAMETPNPNVFLYTDTVQVGDIIALPRFCDFFPVCWLLTPINLPVSELTGIAGYQRYRQEERLYDGGYAFHWGVPMVQYCDKYGQPLTGGGSYLPSSVLFSKTNVALPGGQGTVLSPDHELMVDTMFVKANEAGETYIRFTDPYWANIYFNIKVISVEPKDSTMTSTPCEWNFTMPLSQNLRENGMREHTITKSIGGYWRQLSDNTNYYSSDIGYYGLDYGKKDQKFAPFFMNNGMRLPWFEGIEQCVETPPEDDQHTGADAQWHKAIDRIRIYTDRPEGEAQVAFAGTTTLRIHKPGTIALGTVRNYVPLTVQAASLADTTGTVSCSYTYTDDEGAAQTYKESITLSKDTLATSPADTLSFILYGTVNSDITLTVNNIELSRIRIEEGEQLTYTEQPQAWPTYSDGIYHNGTTTSYYLGSDGRYYLPYGDGYTEVSEADLFTVPYFELRNDCAITKCNSRDAEVIVPDQVPDNHPDVSKRGCNISIIAGGAFADMTTLTKVTIGDQVNHIGTDNYIGAFQGCTNLRELHIGTSLDYCASGCFNGCTGLRLFETTTMRQIGGSDGINELVSQADSVIEMRLYHNSPLAALLTEHIFYGNAQYRQHLFISLLNPDATHTYDANYVCSQCGAVSLTNNANNAPTVSALSGVKTTVTLTGRTLWQDESWNTLVLPFSLTLEGSPLEGATARTLESATLTDGTLSLWFADPVDELQAGVPYIIKWPQGSNIVEPVFRGVVIDGQSAPVEQEPVTFAGSYGPLAIAAEGDNTLLYLGADNTLYYPNGAMTIGAQRATFRLADGITAGDPNDPTASVRNFILHLDDLDDLTPIHSLNADSQSSSLNTLFIYDLQGRKVTTPQRGHIYIVGGKKVIY